MLCNSSVWIEWLIILLKWMLNARVINSLRQNTGLVTVLKLNARIAILLKLNAKMIILWFTVQRTSRPQPRYLLLLRRQPQLCLEGISSIDLKIHHTFNSNIRITHHLIKGFFTIRCEYIIEYLGIIPKKNRFFLVLP